MIEEHPFDPFVPKLSDILILGSFPGKESTQNTRENDWFYGANRNQFWKIIELVYGIILENKSDKQNLFAINKIAITDIILSCERAGNSNSDNNLTNKKYNIEHINKILNEKPIRKILFTSKGVCKEYHEQFEVHNGIELVTLPSPSPIYRRLSLQDKVTEYKKYFLSI